jgi:hypothetical protein
VRVRIPWGGLVAVEYASVFATMLTLIVTTIPDAIPWFGFSLYFSLGVGFIEGTIILLLMAPALGLIQRAGGGIGARIAAATSAGLVTGVLLAIAFDSVSTVQVAWWWTIPFIPALVGGVLGAAFLLGSSLMDSRAESVQIR